MAHALLLCAPTAKLNSPVAELPARSVIVYCTLWSPKNSALSDWNGGWYAKVVEPSPGWTAERPLPTSIGTTPSRRCGNESEMPDVASTPAPPSVVVKASFGKSVGEMPVDSSSFMTTLPSFGATVSMVTVAVGSLGLGLAPFAVSCSVYTPSLSRPSCHARSSPCPPT